MAEQDVPKDWFEFMQKMWNPTSFPMPGMITPTVNVEEIEKKIAELKAVAVRKLFDHFIQKSLDDLQGLNLSQAQTLGDPLSNGALGDGLA